MSELTEHKEVHIKGAPACPGIVIGHTSLYKRERPTVSDMTIADDEVPNHIQEFDDALEKAKEELHMLSENTDDEATNKLIQTQLAILSDPDLYERVEQEISVNKTPVDAAVESVFENYLEMIRENHGSTYLNKSVDISDIRDRLLQILHNKTDEITENTILVAKELSPREIISFSNRNIKGILTDRGGATSHAAIIARAMNIPTVVGLKSATDVISSNHKVVLDGRSGEVVVHP